MINNLTVFGIVLFIIAVFAIGPFLSIYAVNHLFGTAIAMSFSNWIAAVWLHIVVASSTSK